jgi:hypothetical protein
MCGKRKNKCGRGRTNVSEERGSYDARLNATLANQGKSKQKVVRGETATGERNTYHSPYFMLACNSFTLQILLTIVHALKGHKYCKGA